MDPQKPMISQETSLAVRRSGNPVPGGSTGAFDATGQPAPPHKKIFRRMHPE
jgi:hypothetical protein